MTDSVHNLSTQPINPFCNAAEWWKKSEDIHVSPWVKHGVNITVLAILVWAFAVMGWWGRAVLFCMLFVLPISHEMGHYLIGKILRVPFVEVGLGIPEGLGRKFMYQIRLPWVKVPVMVSGILVAAYVDTGEEGRRKLKERSYRLQAWFFGAGVLVHLLQATALFALITAIGWDGTEMSSLLLILCLLITVLVFRVTGNHPERLAAFIPVFGVAIIGLMGWLLWEPFSIDAVHAATNGGALPGQNAAVIGPVSMVRLATFTDDGLTLLIVLLIISSGLAMTNALPFKFLDGGQVLEALFEKYQTPRWIQNTTISGITLVIGVPLLLLVFQSEFGTVGSVLLISYLLVKSLVYVIKRHSIMCPLH
jgi:membrane-associated protease RseP (regulator of RpoE activity)